jgi:putative transposase
MAEAFIKPFKRDYVICENLQNAHEVMTQLPKWIEDYNEKAPNKALRILSPRFSPREYIKKLKRAS